MQPRCSRTRSSIATIPSPSRWQTISPSWPPRSDTPETRPPGSEGAAMPRPIEWRFTASLVAEVLAWIALATIIVILVSALNSSPARSGSLENRWPALLGQPRAVRRLEAHDARALALVVVRDQ